MQKGEAMNRPPDICDRHWQEWEASAIDRFKGSGIFQQLLNIEGKRSGEKLWQDSGVEPSGSDPRTNLEGNLIPQKHWQEWEASAVNPEVIGLNLVSLDGYAPYEKLFYSDAIKRLNSGRLPGWILKKYSHIEHGG